MIKLGVNSVLYKAFPLRTAMENLKKIGCDGFEISAIEGMCEHLDLKNWRAQKSEILELCEEFQLPITATEVASTDPARLTLAFEAAAGLGIPVVNIGPGGKSDVEADMLACVARMNELAAIAESYGVTLCMKAHVGGAVYSTPTTLRLIENVPSAFFGIDMDPSHIFRCGEAPEDALASVVKYMKHVHIRDCGRECLGKGPGHPLQQICGAGDINLYGYFDELVKAGYDGACNLEIIGPELSLAEANIVAASSYGYMNAVLKKLGAR
ncbi:MAG: sugar phosphate isomerase/epimerase [Firmicutes bacterium]|nr:sugar phosphate isomerase/epimerase [Bacillota bacterium]